jgi:hypothetical protein
MPSRFLALIFVLGGVACTPRVEVAVPDKPINININAKIDHEIRIKVERDVEKLMKDQPGLF